MEELIVFLREKPLTFKIVLVLFLAGLGISVYTLQVRSTEQQDEPEIFEPIQARKPTHVKGIHLTSWVAGSQKARKRIWGLLDETELNTIVIGVKDDQGDVNIPGIPLVEKYGTYVNAIPDLQEFLAELKKRGVYRVARIVVFKDKRLSLKRPDLAVKRPDGSVWTDRAGNSWLDPYNKEVWEYTFAVSKRCIEIGFEEIQFDYIRFPSDGDIKQCRYSYAQHNSSSAAANLVNFLEASNKRLKPLGAYLSIDIFGLIPSVDHGMGIGQSLVEMTRQVDFVSPMVYPSHYAKGEYGIPDPNREPYRVVYRTMSDAKKRMGGNVAQLRPYLQDFSMGYTYGPDEVRAQIQACKDLGIEEWLLWNAASQFTRAALLPEKS